MFNIFNLLKDSSILSMQHMKVITSEVRKCCDTTEYAKQGHTIFTDTTLGVSVLF
jgi:hypothetical protein